MITDSRVLCQYNLSHVHGELFMIIKQCKYFWNSFIKISYFCWVLLWYFTEEKEEEKTNRIFFGLGCKRRTAEGVKRIIFSSYPLILRLFTLFHFLFSLFKKPALGDDRNEIEILMSNIKTIMDVCCLWWKGCPQRF